MGPLNKTGKSTMNEAGKSWCAHETVFKRGSKASSKDHTEVNEITHICARKEGHGGPHRSGKVEWGKGSPPHSFKKSS